MLTNNYESHILSDVHNNVHNGINFRNYKKFDIYDLRNARLRNTNITNIHWPADELAEKWSDFKHVFISISNECAPMKTRRLKNRSNPWIDSHILQMMYKRDYFKRKAIVRKDDKLWQFYRHARNNVTIQIQYNTNMFIFQSHGTLYHCHNNTV